MIKNKMYISGLCLVMLLIPASYVQAQMAIGIKAGSTGAGGEFTYSLNERFNARITGTGFAYTHTGEADMEPAVGYDVDGSISSIGLVADYFPFKKFLKLSAGVFYHHFEINGYVAPNETYEVEGKVFSQEKLGSITALVNYDSKIAPYAGIGFGNSVGKGFPVRFSMDIGALYTNSLKINMTGEGMIAPTAEQDQDFEDGLKDFKFFPVVNFGISFRIF